MTGTVDAYRQQVRPGEYRAMTLWPRDRELLLVSRINSSLTELIRDYEHQTEIERNEILDFHVQFEEIFPFEDGNGRVGRLIMFKECLRHGTMPFIIDDKRWSRYLCGFKEWHDDQFEMIDVVLEAQDQFEAQIKLQRLPTSSQAIPTMRRVSWKCCSMPTTNLAASITQLSRPTLRNSIGS